MKKGKVEKKVEVVKNFTPAKDVVPDKLAATLKVREPRQLKQVEPTPPESLEKNPYLQDPLFDEWPAEDAVAGFDFGLTSDKPFRDSPVALPALEEDVLLTHKRYKDYLNAFVEKNPVAISRKSLVRQKTLNAAGPGDAEEPLARHRSGTVEFDPVRLDMSHFQSSLESRESATTTRWTSRSASSASGPRPPKKRRSARRRRSCCRRGRRSRSTRRKRRRRR